MPVTPETGPEVLPSAGFVRQANVFATRITGDGSSGYLAEPGRYQLYASLADPWSHRALIVRRLLGLDRVIGLTLADPIRDERGWRFPASNGGRDPVTGARFVSDLYLVTDPGYRGRFTVPFIWDTRSQRIVNNDFPQITTSFETEFRGFHRPGAPDLYPAQLRTEIDALSTLIYHAVNNGVYKAGLATSQAAYEEAFDALFTTLSALEERLLRRRFLLGGSMTEADVRLYPNTGPLRRRLLHALQVQPAPARRLPAAVGVRPRPVPAPGLRRHDRLRPDQAALLPDPGMDQPEPDRAQGPVCELALTARQRPHVRAIMRWWPGLPGSAAAVAWSPGVGTEIQPSEEGDVRRVF